MALMKIYSTLGTIPEGSALLRNSLTGVYLNDQSRHKSTLNNGQKRNKYQMTMEVGWLVKNATLRADALLKSQSSQHRATNFTSLSISMVLNYVWSFLSWQYLLPSNFDHFLNIRSSQRITISLKEIIFHRCLFGHSKPETQCVETNSPDMLSDCF